MLLRIYLRLGTHKDDDPGLRKNLENLLHGLLAHQLREGSVRLLRRLVDGIESHHWRRVPTVKIFSQRGAKRDQARVRQHVVLEYQREL